MYSTCLFCNSPLGSNEVVEAFPVGRRLAFDAAKGRLWVVCRRCERWNLTPLEERWDAIDDCERRFEHARRRVSTDNIGLARLSEGLELVRIGLPLKREFACWRYGDQFGRRRRRTAIAGSALALAGAAAALGALILSASFGGGYWAYRAGERALIRRKESRLIARIPTDDGETLTVAGEHLPRVRLAPTVGGGVGWQIEIPHVDGVRVLSGAHALHAASLVMPAINKTGGTRRNVEKAISRLDNFDDPTAYFLSAAAECSHPSRPGGSLMKLPEDMRMAVEMAANEESERHAFEGDMWLLENAWQQAEEIASIADTLTVPTEIEIKLLELRRQQSESD